MGGTCFSYRISLLAISSNLVSQLIMCTIDLSPMNFAEEDLYQPLTTSNVDKAAAVDAILSDEDRSFEHELPCILDEEPGFLIGLRVRAAVEKPNLFRLCQRGVVTDIVCHGDRIYVIVTWDNLPQHENFSPEQRTVRFASSKLFKYCEVAFC